MRVCFRATFVLKTVSFVIVDVTLTSILMCLIMFAYIRYEAIKKNRTLLVLTA